MVLQACATDGIRTYTSHGANNATATNVGIPLGARGGGIEYATGYIAVPRAFLTERNTNVFKSMR